MHNYDSLFNDLKNIGIKDTDWVMVHSSLKSVGEIEGRADTLINAMIEATKNGLLVFPTHTWATIREDEQVFDVNNSDSCVGALTNIVRKDSRFIRSNHPTHSVCACGKEANSYIHLDDTATTPTPVNGCFGILKDKNAKILFLGAPLTKNTFVHSVEEYMNVPNRFTEHVYKFYSKNNDEIKEYNMVRHFNAKCPHISDNYEKLLPIMLEHKIAKMAKIGDSLSYLVDAKGCFELVCHILNKDIDALSDMRDINNYCNDFRKS